MAKLYWRIKKNGKWTWRPVSKQFLEHIEPILDMYGIDGYEFQEHMGRFNE